MPEFILKHTRSSNFLSASATGVVISGPLSDGSICLTFLRDSLVIQAEVFDVPEAIAGQEVTLRPLRYETDVVREEVAQISLSQQQFQELFKAMTERVAGPVEAAAAVHQSTVIHG